MRGSQERPHNLGKLLSEKSFIDAFNVEPGTETWIQNKMFLSRLNTLRQVEKGLFSDNLK
jgi:hypothetical protein